MVKKLTDLATLTTADVNDVVLVVDVSANTSKQVPIGGLAAAVLSYADNYKYVEITSPFSTSSTSSVQVTGLTVTFTVPTGGATYMITYSCPTLYNSGATNYSTVDIWDGTVGSGTLLYTIGTYGINGTSLPVMGQRRVALSAGSHTINVGLKTSAGTATNHAGSTNTSNLSVTRVA